MKKTIHLNNPTLEQFEQAVNSFDKLTHVELSTDGKGTRKAEDYSDERFCDAVESCMRKSNSDKTVLRFTMEKSGEIVSIIVKRRGETFKYRYKNTFGYMLTLARPLYPNPRMRLIMAFISDRKRFYDFATQGMRKLAWKSMPI